MISMIIDKWRTLPGWCVDEDNVEDGRRTESLEGYTLESCNALCEANSTLNGCTFMESEKKCTPYTGDIVRGSGDGGYSCYYRAGTQINFTGIKMFNLMIKCSYFKLFSN